MSGGASAAASGWSPWPAVSNRKLMALLPRCLMPFSGRFLDFAGDTSILAELEETGGAVMSHFQVEACSAPGEWPMAEPSEPVEAPDTNSAEPSAERRAPIAPPARFGLTAVRVALLVGPPGRPGRSLRSGRRRIRDLIEPLIRAHDRGVVPTEDGPVVARPAAGLLGDPAAAAVASAGRAVRAVAEGGCRDRAGPSGSARRAHEQRRHPAGQLDHGADRALGTGPSGQPLGCDPRYARVPAGDARRGGNGPDHRHRLEAGHHDPARGPGLQHRQGRREGVHRSARARAAHDDRRPDQRLSLDPGLPLHPAHRAGPHGEAHGAPGRPSRPSTS